MDEALVISLKPSRIERCLQWSLLLLALLALALSGLSALAKVFLALLTLALLVPGLLVPGLLRGEKQQSVFVSTIAWEAGSWWIVRGGQRIAIELRGEQRVLSWLVALQWRESAGTRRGSLALWPDSADAEALRRLRLRLRFP